MTQHAFIPVSTTNFDPDCAVCEGKDRDAIHSAHRRIDTLRKVRDSFPDDSEAQDAWMSSPEGLQLQRLEAQ